LQFPDDSSFRIWKATAADGDDVNYIEASVSDITVKYCMCYGDSHALSLGILTCNTL